MPTHRPDACEVVRRFSGCATWAQILAESTGHSVRKALASGELRRIGKGVYALPQVDLAYPAAVATHGLVSHQSAARHWKLESLPLGESTHVTVPARARPAFIRGVTFHFSDVDGRDDHNGVTSPLRTVLDCAFALPFAEALSIADSALRLDVVTSEGLVAAAHARGGRHRQKVIKVAVAADGRAANPFESGLRAIVIDAGLEGFEPQYPVQLPASVAWVDLGDPVRRIALEADSFQFHGTREALVRDCDRYDDLIGAGWEVLRFSYEHVMSQRERVRSLLLATCAFAPRKPRPGSVIPGTQSFKRAMGKSKTESGCDVGG